MPQNTVMRKPISNGGTSTRIAGEGAFLLRRESDGIAFIRLVMTTGSHEMRHRDATLGVLLVERGEAMREGR
jgi:hypothetical protein